MYSAFQWSAFQWNAFQIARNNASAPLAPNGNRPRDWEYTPTHYELENHRRKLEQYKDSQREAEVELVAVQYKIEDLELKRLRDLADETMQMQLLGLLKEQQIIQQILVELQIKKERWRREEDDILILLLSLPFNA